MSDYTKDWLLTTLVIVILVGVISVLEANHHKYDHCIKPAPARVDKPKCGGDLECEQMYGGTYQNGYGYGTDD